VRSDPLGRGGIAYIALAMMASCGRGAPTDQDPDTHRDLTMNAEHNDAAEFVALSGNDEWARPPDRWPSGASEGVCLRVSEARRAEAIDRLQQESAVAITHLSYRALTGRNDSPHGTPYLLRGFASTNSGARLLVWDDAVIVESGSLGGLFHLRRYPCVAFLDRRPRRVYTYANYDM
jgi:hypothetical protein